MLQKIRDNKKESRGFAAAGFTIIEVMIVLAIAGLIMAIVFLAIPGLQKTNRNTQRKNDVARISSLINDFVANNNGKLPTRLVYVGGTPVTGELDLTKEKFSILDTTTATSITPLKCTSSACVTVALTTALIPDTLQFYTSADCGTGTNAPVFNTSARVYALYYGIEGSTTTQCIAG